MSCIKKCNCSECEMLQNDCYITFIDDITPANDRVVIKGFKCGYTGKCDVDMPSLKKGGFIDTLIFASNNKIAIDYIKLYKNL